MKYSLIKAWCEVHNESTGGAALCPKCVTFASGEPTVARIRACVNACEGMTDEDLKDGGMPFTEFILRHDSTIKDLNDKLTSALNLLEIAIAERDKERAVKRGLVSACKTAVRAVSREYLDKVLDEAIQTAEGGKK